MSVTKDTLDHKILDYVEITGAILEKSSAMLAEKEAQAQKCEKLIASAVDALLTNGRLEPHEKSAALEVLKDPVKVLEVLIKTAGHRNDAERAKLGVPENNGHIKKASYNSLNDAYVGRRIKPGDSESDLAFKRGLGLY